MNYSKSNMRICLALVVSLSLFGCAASNVPLKTSFWQEPEVTVGIAVEKLPVAEAQKLGSQGLLDIAVASIFDANLRNHLEKADLSTFLEIKEKFADQIQKRGLQVKVIEEVIDTQMLTAQAEGTEKENEHNYQALADRYGIDYLLLLKINGAGVVRKYWAFIPLGSPKGYCNAEGELINLDTNQTCWFYSMSPNSSSVNIEGDWDNPPEYREVDNAIEKAIVLAMGELKTNFK